MYQSKFVCVVIKNKSVEVHSTTRKALESLGLNYNTYKSKFVEDSLITKEYEIYKREIKR